MVAISYHPLDLFGRYQCVIARHWFRVLRSDVVDYGHDGRINARR
jgi:hypothetical protein